MDEQTKDDKLDLLLEQAVSSGKVEFDAERWKQRYAGEYDQLVSRCGRVPTGRETFSVYAVRFAAAAVILVAAGLLIHRMHRPVESPRQRELARSPAKMMSRLSLTLAYNRGGMEAVDLQYAKAFEKLGSKPAGLSIAELLNGNGGS
jgi:hypothetical protein